MSSSTIFDTCILIDQIRSAKFRTGVASVVGPIRISSVVLAELLRGVATSTDVKILRALTKNQKILTPTEKNWVESGEILAKMRIDHGFEPFKLRDLHFDVLISLTVRTHGARLITSNRADFELIRKYRDFELEIW